MFGPWMAADPAILPTTPEPVRRVIVVLGMHRSGTSAVAGCLQRLGVYFGPRLMPATPDNPRGYYEHIDLVNLHDRLLLTLGRGWDDTFPFPTGWWQGEAAGGRLRAEALGVLRRDFSTAAPWGLKDPRLCRLLPWWEPLWQEMNSEPLFVIVRRPPLEVAASLARREGFSAAKSSLLWLQHVLEAERHTRGHPRVIVDFKAFLADWRGALEPVRRLLGEPWPLQPPTEDAKEGQFVDPGLLRSALNEGTLAQAPRWLKESDMALQLGVVGQEEAMRLVLDDMTSHLHTGEMLLSPGQDDVAADLNHQLATVRRLAAWYEAEWQKARACTDDVKAKLAAKREEVEKLKKKLSLNDK